MTNNKCMYEYKSDYEKIRQFASLDVGQFFVSNGELFKKINEFTPQENESMFFPCSHSYNAFAIMTGEFSLFGERQEVIPVKIFVRVANTGV